MNGLFLDLETLATFRDFVLKQEANAKKTISEWFPSCASVVDSNRIDLAHAQYKQNIDKFAVLLHSQNPDHYKRAGALLHALYQSEIVTSIDLGESSYGTSRDDLETGFAQASYHDAQHALRFTDFYTTYANQILAFELAYRCCASYEQNPTKIGFDYLHNVCHYLKKNNNLNVDSCFMVFKSLMLR